VVGFMKEFMNETQNRSCGNNLECCCCNFAVMITVAATVCNALRANQLMPK
jgi:hypothetical protein